MAASSSPEIKVWPSASSRRAVSRGRSMRSPATLRAGGQSISRMETLSFRIERDRAHDGRAPLDAEMVYADRLASARQTRFDEAKRDRAAEARTEIARGDVPLHLPRAPGPRRHMRAGR